MTQKKRGLNKGLHALLAETIGLKAESKASHSELVEVQASPSNPTVTTGGRMVVATAPLPSRVSNPAAGVVGMPASVGVIPAAGSMANVAYTGTKLVTPTVATIQTTATAPLTNHGNKLNVEPRLNEGGFGYLNIDLLSPGRFQPRRTINETELEELAASIRAQGVLQPIVVRSIGVQQYEIIAGERRWRASRLAGLLRVPVVVKDISDEQACAIGLIENIQRQALNPMEEAIGIERLIKQFDLTHAEVATAVGKSRTAITNLLRLLNLQEDVKKMLEQGEIDHGHAKVLLAVSGARQSQIARQVADKQLSVRETEDLVNNQVVNQTTVVRNTHKPMDPDVKRLQRELSSRLGAVVKIQHTVKGKGKLVVHYDNLESLEGILDCLK